MRLLELTVLAVGALITGHLAEASPRPPAPAERGLAFANRNCAACHGVTANSPSPNPEAPPWDDIVNHPGTSQATLREYLRDSHNYPEQMKFRVDNARIRDLAAWMITLKREDYQPNR